MSVIGTKPDLDRDLELQQPTTGIWRFRWWRIELVVQLWGNGEQWERSLPNGSSWVGHPDTKLCLRWREPIVRGGGGDRDRDVGYFLRRDCAIGGELEPEL